VGSAPHATGAFPQLNCPHIRTRRRRGHKGTRAVPQAAVLSIHPSEMAVHRGPPHPGDDATSVNGVGLLGMLSPRVVHRFAMVAASGADVANPPQVSSTLSDEQLRLGWRNSFIALQRTTLPGERLLLLETRAALLEVFAHRDPQAFTDWLHNAHAASTRLPASRPPFATHRHPPSATPNHDPLPRRSSLMSDPAARPPPPPPQPRRRRRRRRRQRQRQRQVPPPPRRGAQGRRQHPRVQHPAVRRPRGQPQLVARRRAGARRWWVGAASRCAPRRARWPAPDRVTVGPAPSVPNRRARCCSQ